jgi:aminopeptidase N
MLSTLATSSATATPTAPVEKFRKDYKVPDYSIQSVDLTFKIFEGHTQVRGMPILCSNQFTPLFSPEVLKVLSSLKIKRRSGVSSAAPLRLDAEDLAVNNLKIDGKEISSGYLPFDTYI